MALERYTYSRPPPHDTAVVHTVLAADAVVSRQVTSVGTEAFRASGRGAADGADLGGSSKYSNESFED